MSRETRLGLAYAAAGFVLWGLTPAYWKALRQVPAAEILAHRVAWGFVVVAAWMSLRGQWPALRAAAGNRRTALTLAASTVLIAVNWGLFVWAVNTDRVLDTALGYFINPLVNVLLGLVVLGERLNRLQWLAVGLAGAAVATLTVQLGRLPWVSLALAGSFALYGLLRKTVGADAVVGLAFETAVLAPLAVTFLVLREHRGVAALGHQGPAVDLLLVLSGAVTVVPLILFTLGVRRIPLSTAGLLQYLSPTLTFLQAVLIFHEPFTPAHAASFGMIWIALGLYTADLRRRLRRLEEVAAADPGR